MLTFPENIESHLLGPQLLNCRWGWAYKPKWWGKGRVGRVLPFLGLGDTCAPLHDYLTPSERHLGIFGSFRLGKKISEPEAPKFFWLLRKKLDSFLKKLCLFLNLLETLRRNFHSNLNKIAWERHQLLYPLAVNPEKVAYETFFENPDKGHIYARSLWLYGGGLSHQ